MYSRLNPRIILAVCLVGALVASVNADVPNLINYQGYLTDEFGQPLGDTVEFQVRFTVYDSLEFGNVVWASGPLTDTAIFGQFDVQLGAPPMPVLTGHMFSDTMRFLGVRIGADPEISPRTRLVTVPYAYSAQKADTAKFSLFGGNSGWIIHGDTVQLRDHSDRVVIGQALTPNSKLTVIDDAFHTLAFFVNNDDDQASGVNVLMSSPTGDNKGVYSLTQSSEGYGVFGQTTAPDGVNYGVYGTCASPDGWAVYSDGRFGCVGEDTLQAYVLTTATTPDSVTALRAEVDAPYTGSGVRGSRAVCAINNGEAGIGVYARSDTEWGGYGVYSVTTSTGHDEGGYAYGVYGETNNDYYGIGVSGYAPSYTGITIGVKGKTRSAEGEGVHGEGHTGVYGEGDQYGVYGLVRDPIATAGFFENTDDFGWAGQFIGNVQIVGTLIGGKSGFAIDNPADPENEILRHSNIASDEDLLIYRGKVTLDAEGTAEVSMPDYFVALSREDEATVSVSAIGRPFLTGYEWQPDFSRFTIYGDANRDISWVVYAERDDAVARAYSEPTVELKGSDSRLCQDGKLLYTREYGFPEASGNDYERSRRVKKRGELRQAAELKGMSR